VFDVLALTEDGMDEGVKVAILEFDGGVNAVSTPNLSHRFDNLQPVVHLALVVVGHLKDKKVLE
jgi:hypothetical protein